MNINFLVNFIITEYKDYTIQQNMFVEELDALLEEFRQQKDYTNSDKLRNLSEILKRNLDYVGFIMDR